MNEQVYIVSDILKALSNPNRLMIVCLLQKKRLTVTDLHQKMDNISMAALSQHLSVLKSLGFIDSNKKGQYIYYQLKDQRIIQIINLLKNLYCKDL